MSKIYLNGYNEESLVREDIEVTLGRMRQDVEYYRRDKAWNKIIRTRDFSIALGYVCVFVIGGLFALDKSNTTVLLLAILEFIITFALVMRLTNKLDALLGPIE
jgi:hypothetical protein